MPTLSQPHEPGVKRAVAFIDGQNLFRCARSAFGHKWPNYRFPQLASAVCRTRGWTLTETRFYTGVAAKHDHAQWHDFWSKRLLAMSRSGVVVYSRAVRYRDKEIKLTDGTIVNVRMGEEKGIDVRIALDVVMGAVNASYDVALIFSQDQDLNEAVREVKLISAAQARWIKLACAFPFAPGSSNKRGIDGTDWIRIDRLTYDQYCDQGR